MQRNGQLSALAAGALFVVALVGGTWLRGSASEVGTPVDREAWNALSAYSAIWAEHYDSLEQMAVAAAAGGETAEGVELQPGAVIVAKIDSVVAGRPGGDEPGNEVATVELALRVSEVLAGDPDIGTMVSLEMLNPAGNQMTPPELNAALSGAEGLFFLRRTDSEGGTQFWRKVNDQGILLNDQGVVYAAMLREEDELGSPLFPGNLNGQPFDAVVALVEVAVG
ncbi:MAG: hypothetical protein H0W94_04545 [Actinobacteria bacterium]|nr:hypothetical protein [Actinomycetota bacterium]